MVKIIFKLGSPVLALVIGLGLSKPALAVSPQPSSEGQTSCQKIADFTANASVQLSGRLADLKKAHQDQTAQLSASRANYSQKLAQARSAWSEKKAQQYDRLMSQASDAPGKKAAVLAFRTGVEAAATERQNKIDTIISSYRAELDNAIVERNDSIDQAAGLLQATLNQAFEEAKTSCSGDALAAKQALVSKITTARQTFNDRLALINTNLNKRLDDLRARQSDLDAAVEKFKQKAQTFRDGLSDKLESSAR